MNIQHAIRLTQEACALNHPALSTEKTYVYWIRLYASFLQQPQRKPLLTPEAKMEGFLTQLALKGVSASTQNQALSALRRGDLFGRDPSNFCTSSRLIRMSGIFSSR
jgi:site-specific recombinase XerD